MSAPDRADLFRAKEVVRVTGERGVIHEDDLVGILDCTRTEMRVAIGIAYHWRRIDRCGLWLVAVPLREGRPAA
jgi:hypothetical protein